MKSPFPGMDPYLANHWGDVRSSIIVYGSGQLNQILPADLVARNNSRELSDIEAGELPTERFIEIREPVSDYRLVTLIRFIDPRERSVRDRIRGYWTDHLQSESDRVSLIEVDLVCDRQVVIQRMSCWNRIETILMSVRENIPSILIPLRAHDSDVSLRLQPLIDRAYASGRYDSINYQLDADPPLKGEDAEWADALLRTAGKRQ
jgi:hypothetical protein